MKLYTKEMFLIAAEKCEVSMIDAEHIMKYIDEYVVSIELPISSKEKSEKAIIPDPSDAVTRLEIIDKQGRVYSQWNCTIQLSYQDDGKTLKIFVNN